MFKTIKNILKTHSGINPNSRYKHKGGWPGLSILPNIDYLIDVGIGHQGTYGLYSYFPKSTLLFVDPLIETKAAVQSLIDLDKGHKFICAALGANIGSVNINVRHPISRSGIHDSFGEDKSFFEQRTVPLLKLDEILKHVKLGSSLGIKIDVEGYELEVLKGGTDSLRLAKFIILELPVGGARFTGSYTMEEAFKFMSDNNYKATAIRSSGDGTNHCDVAFVNDGSGSR